MDRILFRRGFAAEEDRPNRRCIGDHVESRHMGAAGGLFFSAAEIGGVLGPPTIGALSDATGSFDAGLLVLAAVSAVMLVVLFFHRASERRESAIV